MAFDLLHTRRAVAVKDIEDVVPLVRYRLKVKLEALRQDPVGLSRRLTDLSIGQYRRLFR